MFKQFKFPLMITLMNFSSLFAYTPLCPENWNISASYLYLLPSVEDSYFVLDAPQTAPINAPNGTRENNPFSFHSGFRVGAAYGLCEGNRTLSASYSRLCTQQSRTVSGNFLWATLGSQQIVNTFRNYTGFASANSDVLYQHVDGLFDQQLWCCYELSGSLHTGFEYAYVRLREEYIYQSAANRGVIHEKSKLWGIGPKLGLGLDYSLCQSSWGGIVLTSSGSASILASQSELDRMDSFGAATVLDISDEPVWRLIPAFHAQIGLNYGTCFSFGNLSLEIGYEFSSYLRSTTRITPAASAAGAAILNTQYFNFSVHGLYVEANITF